MGRPTLDGIRQASMSTINKGKLMVGLTSEEDMESQVTNDSESTYLDEAASLLCPDMTFQQRLIGFASCFTIGCKLYSLRGGGIGIALERIVYPLHPTNPQSMLSYNDNNKESHKLMLFAHLSFILHYRFDHIHVLQIFHGID